MCSQSPCFLEKFEGSGLTERGIVDATKSDARKKQEQNWIRKLRTVFPYGLNFDYGFNSINGDSFLGEFLIELLKGRDLY